MRRMVMITANTAAVAHRNHRFSRMEAIKAGLKDGSFSIWKGPLMDNTGKEILKKDEIADDKFLSGIKFFVKGVEGKVPGGDK